MSLAPLLRIGAAAAVLGVIAQLAAAMLEPARIGDADAAIRTVAESGGWTGRWLVHLTGIVLLIAAIAIVTRTFSEGQAKEWARAGQPLFVVAGALGVAEVLVGASTKDLADGWASAAPEESLPYLTAFEGAWNATVDLDFGALFVFGIYLGTLAVAILAGNVYARWLGWTCAVAAPLLVVGIVLELSSVVGTALVLVGNVLFFVVLIGLGVAMWRKGAASDATVTETPGLVSGSLVVSPGHATAVGQPGERDMALRTNVITVRTKEET